METVGFIGLGNMGLPMVRNLLKSGLHVQAYDVADAALEAAEASGAVAVANAADAARGADCVVTMLPEGAHVRAVYAGPGGVIAAAPKGALLIDCSTVDVDSARAVHEAAEKERLDMVDAPVSGGVAGAASATLTFMVGGSDQAFARAKPVLERMGKAVIHAGRAGNGQAAKICNNMILGVSMIAVSEAFLLGERLGLDPQKLFDISSKASGQCWSMTSYCPVPGPVPTSPANRDYQPGFTAAMMLKDLKLAQQAAHSAQVATPLGAEAQALYALMCASGRARVDFSGIIRLLAGR